MLAAGVRWRYIASNPAIEAGANPKPRSTFASNALAAGVTVFELARVMGTSVPMIEWHYGALIDGAPWIIGRLDAIEATLERVAKRKTDEMGG